MLGNEHRSSRSGVLSCLHFPWLVSHIALSYETRQDAVNASGCLPIYSLASTYNLAMALVRKQIGKRLTKQQPAHLNAKLATT